MARKYRDHQHEAEARRLAALYLSGAIERDEFNRQTRMADRLAYRREIERTWSNDWIARIGNIA